MLISVFKMQQDYFPHIGIMITVVITIVITIITTTTIIPPSQQQVWNLTNCKIQNQLVGHTGYVNTVTVSPDGSLCASGGKDHVAMLWDLAEGKRLYSLDAGDIIHALCFSPNRYWLCAATQSCIKIWDLESKSVVDELRPQVADDAKDKKPYCVSLAWSADGETLFAGYTDGLIRVWAVSRGL